MFSQLTRIVFCIALCLSVVSFCMIRSDCAMGESIAAAKDLFHLSAVIDRRSFDRAAAASPHAGKTGSAKGGAARADDESLSTSGFSSEQIAVARSLLAK